MTSFLKRVGPLRRSVRGMGLPGVEWLDQRAEALVYEWKARADAGQFAEVERFCLFVGFPRSGGSLTGAMLDAHPDMAIAHELGALRKIDQGFSRTALYAALMKAERKFAANGSVNEGDAFAVPGQWQGRVRRLRVIGDKHAQSNSNWLSADPSLLARLAATVEVPVRVVVVVRHPSDTIARIARRGSLPVIDAVSRYDHFAEAVQLALADVGSGGLVVHHEDTVADPGAQLRRLAAFLEVDAPDDWVEACAGLVLPSPRLARDAVDWTPAEELLVTELIERFTFLQRYRLA